jgi:hypothetical protein
MGQWGLSSDSKHANGSDSYMGFAVCRTYSPIRLDGALSDKVDSLERDWFKLKYELMLVVCSMSPTEYPANLPATVRL